MWYGDDNNPDDSQSSEIKTDAATEERRPRRRGFAAMDRDRVREIASKGGKAAHSAGTAHQFSSEEARVAGRKGGMAPHIRRGGVRRRPTAEAPSSASSNSHTEHGSDNR
ncbi:MAG: KGG domain-containing protein [Polyangiaceae bacterium]|nr:KGG domain-containing protein [Polyangiaceae bacterium]